MTNRVPLRCAPTSLKNSWPPDMEESKPLKRNGLPEPQCRQPVTGGNQTSYCFATFTTWISVKPSRPHGPFSTPIPDHLAPPKGRLGAIARCWFTHAEPHSSCLATSAACSESLPQTEPLNP